MKTITYNPETHVLVPKGMVYELPELPMPISKGEFNKDLFDEIQMHQYAMRYLDEAIAAAPQPEQLVVLFLENHMCNCEWRDIKTAPKDGTVFLGYKLGQFRECYKVQRDDCDMWCFGGTSGADDLFPNIKPTHWMPLPKAPNGASS